MVVGLMMRYYMKKADDVRDKGLKRPEDVTFIRNKHYGIHPHCQSLDIYKPKGHEDEKLPLIISIHGGGWVYGDKERYLYYCASLAQRGFAVINFTYRLAPFYKYPRQLQDCIKLLKWALKNQEKYHLDMDNAFLLGDSAGGDLTALVNCLLTDKAYAEEMKIKVPEGFRFKAIGLNCGAYEHKIPEPLKETAAEQEKQMYQMNLGLLSDYLGRNYKDKLHQASPIFHINKDFPPAYILSANKDFLKDDAYMMEKKYTELGLEHGFKIYGDDKHPLQHVFFCNMREEEGKKAMDDELNFFKKFIKN